MKKDELVMCNRENLENYRKLWLIGKFHDLVFRIYQAFCLVRNKGVWLSQRDIFPKVVKEFVL
jgi:hypothetical protein